MARVRLSQGDGTDPVPDPATGDGVEVRKVEVGRLANEFEQPPTVVEFGCGNGFLVARYSQLITYLAFDTTGFVFVASDVPFLHLSLITGVKQSLNSVLFLNPLD